MMGAGLAMQAIGQGFELGGNIAQMVPTWGERQDKQLLKRDMNLLRSGNLGLTQAERSQAIQRAMQAAGQQAGQAQMQVARDSLSDQGNRNLGQYAQAQQMIGQQATEAGAQSAAQADTLSQQLAEARRQEILGRLQDRIKTGMQRQMLQVEGAKNIGKQFQNMGKSGMMGNAIGSQGMPNL